jgi:ferredoxin
MPYTIKIDRSLCSGYGDCVALAPDVFAHDEDTISVVVDPEGAEDELILDAARACPVDAITLVDEHGDQVWP